MKQLTQNLKNGDMQILEVPFPAVGKGQVLVRNHYSVISAGTEGKTVKDARAGYLAKAKSRQKEVSQVIELAKTQGIAKTYEMVMNKLEAHSQLGYSSAGEVIEAGEGITEFKAGDLVACGGSGAVHAEVIAIPKHLSAKIPTGAEVKHAAFATVAAIALQGIRQADLKLGETCAVIGLGLIGQLTVQLLKAGGISAIGIDINPVQVELANKSGANLALERQRTGLEPLITEFTRGYGVDAVIITAGTSSLDPVELAGRLCRKKGKVVIVGAVPTGFSRENYYKKELELRMSSSYGPGRYEPNYEEKGIDYPIGYVRWTENRNMQAYLDLLAQGKLNIDPLITHTFDFENAPQAYDLILNNSESYTGILLKYDTNRELARSVKTPGFQSAIRNPQSAIQIGFIGAGSFAQNFLLPNIPGDVNLIGVATARGNTARTIADKYKFEYASGNADEIIQDERINTVFIATRHNLHAEYVIKALQSGKNVFVEKPLAITGDELEEIRSVYAQQLSTANCPLLFVGFNRRFSPHIRKLKKTLPDELPKAIQYRINAGAIPSDHWVHDPEVGGGRITGEVCHFIDLAMFLAGSDIASIYASAFDSDQHLTDTVIINLEFGDGSIASISYFSNGNKQVNKEYLEVFWGNQIAVLDDFGEMTIYGGKKEKTKSRRQDKGYAYEIQQFLNAIREGTESPIPFEELYQTTLATFKIIESIQKRAAIRL